MDNKSDPRTTNWFLMSSPLPTIIICLSYAYFVKVDKHIDCTLNDIVYLTYVRISDSWTKANGKQKAIQAEKGPDSLQFYSSSLQLMAFYFSCRHGLANRLQL